MSRMVMIDTLSGIKLDLEPLSKAKKEDHHPEPAEEPVSKSLHVRSSERVLPGLFVKAVPIIGGGDEKKETPKLVLPGAQAKPSAKLVTPGPQPKPSAQVSTPGGGQPSAGLVSAAGSKISAPKPAVFQGSTPKPQASAAPASKPGGGLVAPGPQAKPDAKLALPGAGSPRQTAGLSRTPTDQGFQKDKQLVDPQGKPVSSALASGPGAAKPTPKLALPGQGSSSGGPLVKPSGVVGGKEQTAGAEAVTPSDHPRHLYTGNKWSQLPQKDQKPTAEKPKFEAAAHPTVMKIDAAADMAKQRQAAASAPPTPPSDTAPSPQLSGGSSKQGGSTAGPQLGGGKQATTSSPQHAPISSANLMADVASGAAMSNLQAPLTPLAMDAASTAQRVTSRGAPVSREKDTGAAMAQRADIASSGRSTASTLSDSAVRNAGPSQSSMKNKSMRLYVNG